MLWGQRLAARLPKASSIRWHRWLPISIAALRWSCARASAVRATDAAAARSTGVANELPRRTGLRTARLRRGDGDDDHGDRRDVRRYRWAEQRQRGIARRAIREHHGTTAGKTHREGANVQQGQISGRSSGIPCLGGTRPNGSDAGHHIGEGCNNHGLRRHSDSHEFQIAKDGGREAREIGREEQNPEATAVQR